MSFVIIIFLSFLLVFLVVLQIHSIEEKNKFKHAVSQEEYEILVNLVKGEFNTTVKERTRLQKNAIIRFWRVKLKYKVDNFTQTILFYNGKRVLKNNEVKKAVKEAFDKSKSAGYKKIKTRVAASSTGLSNKKILEITKRDIQYKHFSVKFKNKAKLRPVRANAAHDCHQIDLVDMVKMKLERKGKCYKYIPSLLDIFSRFH